MKKRGGGEGRGENEKGAKGESRRVKRREKEGKWSGRERTGWGRERRRENNRRRGKGEKKGEIKEKVDRKGRRELVGKGRKE